MPKAQADPVAREERALRRLGTRKPVCCQCGESDWRCLEDHHVAGRAHHTDTVQICRNCHRKLSDAQKDHPAAMEGQDPKMATIGYVLVGLADFFKLLAERLMEFGLWLIEQAQVAAGKEASS